MNEQGRIERCEQQRLEMIRNLLTKSERAALECARSSTAYEGYQAAADTITDLLGD